METANKKKLKMQTMPSILIIVIGVVLLIYMIVVESEPGAIPLLLIGFGTAWYFIIRYKVRTLHT